MGQSVSRPLPGETPVDFMFRNNKGYWTQPFVDNLAGWSESAGSQIDDYPRCGSFKKDDMDLMKSMVKSGWGDPQWDYKYMNDSCNIWTSVKRVWDRGPERADQLKNASITPPEIVKQPPSYDTAVNVNTVQNHVPTSSQFYPSLLTISSSAQTPAPPLQLSEQNREALASKTVQPTMAWIQDGPRIVIRPATMSDIDTICKNLPNPSNSTKFVDVLRSHTRYAQLNGADYRSILLRVLADDVTEVSLIEQIPALCMDNDNLDGSGILRDPHELWWTDSDNVSTFFEQVKRFLDDRAHVCRDLTYATNTKQNKGETVSAFVSRFKRAWDEDARIPMKGDLAPLFINTCLNNMQPDAARLIRITTANLLQIPVDDFCKRIRELDASGGFSAFLLKPTPETMLAASMQHMAPVSARGM